MKDIALLLGVLIILGGVGWYLFNSIEVVEAPVDVDTDQSQVSSEQSDSSDSDTAPAPTSTTDSGLSPERPVACTKEAKICPDGSGVGRTGPNCEFAACPGEMMDDSEGKLLCSPESKLAEMCTMEYAPVCGLVEVQCVTTPCDPVSQTFSNACSACASGNVSEFTPGACLAQ